jgi:hypothetical protein
MLPMNITSTTVLKSTQIANSKAGFRSWTCHFALDNPVVVYKAAWLVLYSLCIFPASCWKLNFLSYVLILYDVMCWNGKMAPLIIFFSSALCCLVLYNTQICWSLFHCTLSVCLFHCTLSVWMPPSNIEFLHWDFLCHLAQNCTFLCVVMVWLCVEVEIHKAGFLYTHTVLTVLIIWTRTVCGTKFQCRNLIFKGGIQTESVQSNRVQ